MSSTVTSLPSCVTCPLAQTTSEPATYLMLSIMCVPSTIRSCAPGTVVALPLAAQRLQLSDGPILDHRPGPLLIRVRPPVRHGHPRPRPLARLQHGVRIRQRPRERLLAEESLDPRFRRRNDHLRPPVEPSRTHRNEVEPLPLQHLAVVAVHRPRPRTSPSVTQPVRIVVRNRHEVHARHPQRTPCPARDPSCHAPFSQSPQPDIAP